MEAVGAAPNRAKAKCRKALRPVGEPACGGEARYPSGVARSGNGVGAKFRVLTRGDLSASAAARPQAVVIEDERTR